MNSEQWTVEIGAYHEERVEAQRRFALIRKAKSKRPNRRTRGRRAGPPTPLTGEARPVETAPSPHHRPAGPAQARAPLSARLDKSHPRPRLATLPGRSCHGLGDAVSSSGRLSTVRQACLPSGRLDAVA